MIESVHIENLGVIEQADLNFGPGLTALTGETGAGKTMVLTSLGLLLGERSDPQIVRAGAQRCLVEGAWSVIEDSRAALRAQEAGAELDEDLLLASRAVPAHGRSRAYLGGHSVPASVLAQVGAELIAIHGQSEQIRLRSTAAQRAALDAFGGSDHRQLCHDYAAAYRKYRDTAEQLHTWRAASQQRAQEVADLTSRLDKLEALAPQPGEDVALAEEAARLDHVEELRLGSTQALAALSRDEEAAYDAADANQLLADARRAIETAADHDPALSDIAARIQQLLVLSTDIAADLNQYVSNLDADPQRLAAVQQRRSNLHLALREIPTRSVENVDELLAWGQQTSAYLAELNGPYDKGSALEVAAEAAQNELQAQAQVLSEARGKLAAELSQRVSAELAGLEMKGSTLQVELSQLDEPGPTGAENVAFLLQAHPGATPLPLGKGASGGELSRIMLALEVVLAQHSEHSSRTFVFDEIDAGVGGKAALEIGRRLARLARTHQVIVVTHLAQVAAWADTQLVVEKSTTTASAGQSEVTRTRVMQVSGVQRERELARMLSGHDESDTALRHAAELLAQANVAESQL